MSNYFNITPKNYLPKILQKLIINLILHKPSLISSLPLHILLSS